MTLYLIKLTSKTMHWNVYVRLSAKLSQRNFRKLTYGVTSVLLSFGIPTKVRNKLHNDKRKLRSRSVVSDHKIRKIKSVLTFLDFQISEGVKPRSQSLNYMPVALGRWKKYPGSVMFPLLWPSWFRKVPIIVSASPKTSESSGQCSRLTFRASR